MNWVTFLFVPLKINNKYYCGIITWLRGLRNVFIFLDHVVSMFIRMYGSQLLLELVSYNNFW